MLLNSVRRYITNNTDYAIGINGFDNVYEIMVRDDTDTYNSNYLYTESAESSLSYNYITLLAKGNYLDVNTKLNQIDSLLNETILNTGKYRYIIQKVGDIALNRIIDDGVLIYSILYKCIGKRKLYD